MRKAIRDHLRDVLAILGLLVLATAVAIPILSNQRLRFPVFDEQPKRIEVELADAQAVQPGQGQTVRVAGVEVGRIGKVSLHDGHAVVQLEIEREYEDLIRRDASALLRPKTALKDMFLEVTPGTGPVLPEGGAIPARNTLPDIDPDEVYEALDADTRPYLKLLVSGAGKGLHGHGDDLNAVFKRLEPLHRDLARVTQATAARRIQLKRLVHRYGLLTDELGEHPDDLRRLVAASRGVFDALDSQRQNVEASVARLPGALRQTEGTLRRVTTFAPLLRSTVESLRAPIRKLDDTNRAVIPFADRTEPALREQIRPFVRAARPFTGDLRETADDTVGAVPELDASLEQANRFFNIGAYNPGGAESLEGKSLSEQRKREEGYLYWLAWTAQNGVSLLSTADPQGPWRRVTICGLPGETVKGVVGAVLAELQARNPDLVNDLIGGPLSDGIGESSPVGKLLDSQFGSCNFNALPGAP
jgi:phospholipid/cholesterol/gamma-HCH transport system substrate-binding protein